MRLAYLVHGHKYPDQMARLVRRIQCEDSQVWWHVSKVNKGVDGRVKRLLADTPNVHQVPSQNAYYCHWSVVRAILLSLRQAVDSRFPFDYVILVTGQDYPLLNRDAMLEFFRRLDGKSLLAHFKLPSACWRDGGLRRYQNYHVLIPESWPRPRTDHWREIKPPFERKLPQGIQLWGGAAYWALSRSHAEHLLRMLATNRSLERLFRFTWAPDEIFVHSVLLSTLPSSEFHNQASSLAIWERPNPPYPAILKAADFDMLVSSGYPFARKFDATVDSEVLDLLDNYSDTISREFVGLEEDLPDNEAVGSC